MVSRAGNTRGSKGRMSKKEVIKVFRGNFFNIMSSDGRIFLFSPDVKILRSGSGGSTSICFYQYAFHIFISVLKDTTTTVAALIF